MKPVIKFVDKGYMPKVVPNKPSKGAVYLHKGYMPKVVPNKTSKGPVYLQRQTSGLDSEVGGHSAAWSEPDATSFMVRGSDYMKTRRKVNSDKAIYRYICTAACIQLGT